jgi:hypothetical protein
MNKSFMLRGRPQHGPGNTTTRRRAKWLAVIAAITLPVAIVTAPFALAGTTPPFTIGPPNAAVVPGSDASQTLDDPEGNVKELGPLNSNTTKIGVIHNDVVPTLGLTNPNGQVDLRQAFLGTKKDADGDDWIYFAWERDNNTGSGFISFEFMKSKPPAACGDYSGSQDSLIATCNPWANRQAGDFMILWDQQGGSKDLFLRTWSGTAPNLTLSAPQLLNANVSDAEYSADGFFGEGALNLTDAIFGGAHSCVSFANVIPSTVTGNSDSADYKDTVLQPIVPIGNCTSTTVTTPKDGAGANIPAGGASITTAGVIPVKDSAVVDIQGGTATPTGSVVFFLCKVNSPALCNTGGTSVGSTNLTGASYPVTVVSPTAYVTSAGRYCWRGEFSGDPVNNITGSSDSAATECFTVNPVTPTLSTTAGADVVLGSPVTDTAALSGTAKQPANPVINLTGAAGAVAGGTITFKLYGPSDSGCGPLVFTSSAVSVSGDATYGPVSFTPTAAGNYHWVAEYSGNLPNTNGATHNTACTDTNEDVTVNTVPSTLSTEQEWVPNDSATVSATAGGNLAGSVTFTLYPSSDCTGTPVFPSATVSVAGASPQKVSTSNTTKVKATGTFSWRVTYDSTNDAQRDITQTDSTTCQETSVLTVSNGGTVSSP